MAFFFYTRMGWLVPVIWLGAVLAWSQVSTEVSTRYGMGLSHVSFVFAAAAAASVPLLLLTGAALNREKVPVTIGRFGWKREVMVGTHTFYFMPIGAWAVVVPAATLLSYLVFPLADSLADLSIFQPDQPSAP